MRSASRLLLTLALTAALAAPSALAATPTATTASPSVTTTPSSPPPGSAFSPLSQGVDPGTQTQTTVTATKRAGDTNSGHSTLIFLSLVALLMIVGVGVFIWWEGRKSAVQTKRRRQRMRSGRGPQTLAATAGDGRRGPPPPPRKRRQQAKRKKR